jgi:hypothetical protein
MSKRNALAIEHKKYLNVIESINPIKSISKITYSRLNKSTNLKLGIEIKNLNLIDVNLKYTPYISYLYYFRIKNK